MTRLQSGIYIIISSAITALSYLISSESRINLFKSSISISKSDAEFKECLICLVVSGTILFILAIYLNEVIPSEYRATKHP